jgi:hypothetical protein
MYVTQAEIVDGVLRHLDQQWKIWNAGPKNERFGLMFITNIKADLFPEITEEDNPAVAYGIIYNAMIKFSLIEPIPAVLEILEMV